MKFLTVYYDLDDHGYRTSNYNLESGALIMSDFSWCHGPKCHGNITPSTEFEV